MSRVITHKHSVAPVTALLGAAAVFAIIGWAPIPRQAVQAAPVAPVLSAADITAAVKAALPEPKPVAPVTKTIVKTIVKKQVVRSAPIVRYVIPVYGCSC